MAARWKSREICFSPEYMERLQQDLTMMDPMEFLIEIEEIEAKLKNEIQSETKGEQHDYAQYLKQS